MPLSSSQLNPAILEARQLHKVYGLGDAQTIALRGVDLTLRSGEYLAIMGPSGSGKSTLLHLIGGVEPPTSGEVLLEGAAFSTLDDDRRSIIRRRRIGFVFQRINLLPTLSAQENVALPLLLDQQPRGAALQRAAAALESVNMGHRKKHLPHMMSGGERQRVAIARALVIEPALILADEPTGALDTAMGKEILKLLRASVDQRRSLIIVTHDPQVAAEADRMVVVRDGAILPSVSALMLDPVTSRGVG
jgi:putative ABC transport system ATP-binding protein